MGKARALSVTFKNDMTASSYGLMRSRRARSCGVRETSPPWGPAPHEPSQRKRATTKDTAKCSKATPSVVSPNLSALFIRFSWPMSLISAIPALESRSIGFSTPPGVTTIYFSLANARFGQARLSRKFPRYPIAKMPGWRRHKGEQARLALGNLLLPGVPLRPFANGRPCRACPAAAAKRTAAPCLVPCSTTCSAASFALSMALTLNPSPTPARPACAGSISCISSPCRRDMDRFGRPSSARGGRTAVARGPDPEMGNRRHQRRRIHHR